MALYALKKQPFLQTKSFSFAENFSDCSQKSTFSEQKAFLLHKPFFVALKSCLFAYKKLLIRINLSVFSSKAPLFRPPPPISAQP